MEVYCNTFCILLILWLDQWHWLGCSPAPGMVSSSELSSPPAVSWHHAAWWHGHSPGGEGSPENQDNLGETDLTGQKQPRGDLPHPLSDLKLNSHSHGQHPLVSLSGEQWRAVIYEKITFNICLVTHFLIPKQPVHVVAPLAPRVGHFRSELLNIRNHSHREESDPTLHNSRWLNIDL